MKKLFTTLMLLSFIKATTAQTWSTSSSNLYNNPTSGNVGIGTSSPGEKLHVVGTLKVDGTDGTGGIRVFKNGATEITSHLYLGNNNNDRAFNFQLNSDGSAMTLWSYNGSAWANKFTFTNDGKLGMGTTSPTARLHMSTSSSESGFIIDHTYTGPYSYGELIKVKNDLTKAIAVENNVSTTKEVFKVMGDGRVIIGEKISSAHPTASLTVAGKIVCQDFYVTALSDWPDYVFANNYKLPALADIKKYYTVNNHLPGVPSASDIEENGLNLKEMSSIQMKKIEELTIYMVEMKEEIERLKKENEDLKSKIK